MNAKLVLRKARDKAEIKPDIIVSDGLQAYKKACKIFGKKVKHCVSHFEAKLYGYEGKIIKLSNNRIERLNSDIDLFLHARRGLKNFKTAFIWFKAFELWQNWLKPKDDEARVWKKIPVLVASLRNNIKMMIIIII
jgi:transposase-like protein